MIEKSKMSISLDNDVVELTQKIATRDSRTFSNYVNMVLKQNIKEHAELLELKEENN